MPIIVKNQFKNLKKDLKIPDDTDLIIFTGLNNSGKTALLLYLNQDEEMGKKSDYISPRRFDHSNEVQIGTNYSKEIENNWKERKRTSENNAEVNAPDAIRELIDLNKKERDKIIEWHNLHFGGQLSIERSNKDNEYSSPTIRINDKLVSQQGSGSRAVLAVLCALLHPSREIILIDEPEIGLEPKTQKQLAKLIKQVSKGEDGHPKKRIYVATHSHLFLDRETLTNNYVVEKGNDGYTTLRKIETREDFHDLIYTLLGNSPEDLYFPSNILIVEGPSDQIFLEKLLKLSGIFDIAIHPAEGAGKINSAIEAIQQMLNTQAYIPWYKQHLCILVDSSVSDNQLNKWQKKLDDDGTRVKKLSQNGIEYFYPKSIIASLSGLSENQIERELATFNISIQNGSRMAKIGNFEGTKKELANQVISQFRKEHLDKLDKEIKDFLEVIKQSSHPALNIDS